MLHSHNTLKFCYPALEPALEPGNIHLKRYTNQILSLALYFKTVHVKTRSATQIGVHLQVSQQQSKPRELKISTGNIPELGEKPFYSR